MLPTLYALSLPVHVDPGMQHCRRHRRYCSLLLPPLPPLLRKTGLLRALGRFQADFAPSQNGLYQQCQRRVLCTRRLHAAQALGAQGLHVVWCVGVGGGVGVTCLVKRSQIGCHEVEP